MIILFHSMRDAPTVDEQPWVVPFAWRAVQTQTGVCHLVLVMPGGSLRLTSPIGDFKPDTGTVTTASGRQYRLMTLPAEGEEVVHLVMARAALELQGTLVDVSGEFCGHITDFTGLPVTPGRPSS